MNQWLNRSHPPTLQAAVILGYLSAVLGLLFFPALYLLPLYLGVGVGAFATANNRRWGYILLAVCAVLIALLFLVDLVDVVLAGTRLETTLLYLNRTVFPTALAVAVVHAQSREYQKIWFD